MGTKFREIPVGALFRLDGEGLLMRPTNARALGPFRKVAVDEAVHTADRLEARWYVPPAATVVRIEQQHDGTDPAAPLPLLSPDAAGALQPG